MAAAVVLLVAAVSGCSSSDAAPAEVGPLASASASASASTATAEVLPSGRPSPSAISTARTATSRPEIPSAAAEETPQGASAFTRYFFEQVNQAYASRDASQVARISHSECNSCDSIIGDIERLAAAELEVGGSRFKMDYVETARLEIDRVIVDYRFDADAYIERAIDGAVTRTVPRRLDVIGQARLIRDNQGWLMYGLRLVEG